jgi:hypothetical protein
MIRGLPQAPVSGISWKWRGAWIALLLSLRACPLANGGRARYRDIWPFNRDSPTCKPWTTRLDAVNGSFMTIFWGAKGMWGGASCRMWRVLVLAILLIAPAASCTGPDRPPPPADLHPGSNDGQDATTTPIVEPSSDAAATVVDASSDAPSDAGHGADSTPADALAACTGGQADADIALMMCGGQCVNVDTDNANCGNCGQPCGIVTGTSCDHGNCKCPTPQVVCSNQCVDTTKDQSNCGFCGHNCQGNPCTLGLCQASNIAQVTSSNTHISGIAVDSTMVYWTQGTGTGSGAYGKPFAGGSAVPFGPSVDPRGIAVDLTHVYWVDYGTGSVSSALLLGGGPVTLVPAVGDAGPSPGPTAITSDAHNVYWVDSTLGTVNQMPIQGGAIVTLASGQLTPVAIAVDMNNVYWTDYGSVANNGSVNKAPIGSQNSVTPLASSEQQPSGIAVDAATVYWTDRANPSGTVKSISIQGGAINPIAKDQGAPTGVAIDSQFVYWTNYDDNTVLKAPIAGGMSFTLASGQNNPSAIAVDDKNVYWANQGSGYILKVSK